MMFWVIFLKGPVQTSSFDKSYLIFLLCLIVTVNDFCFVFVYNNTFFVKPCARYLRVITYVFGLEIILIVDQNLLDHLQKKIGKLVINLHYSLMILLHGDGGRT